MLKDAYKPFLCLQNHSPDCYNFSSFWKVSKVPAIRTSAEDCTDQKLFFFFFYYKMLGCEDCAAQHAIFTAQHACIHRYWKRAKHVPYVQALEMTPRSEAIFYLRQWLVHNLTLVITGLHLEAELSGAKINSKISAAKIYYNTPLWNPLETKFNATNKRWTPPKSVHDVKASVAWATLSAHKWRTCKHWKLEWNPTHSISKKGVHKMFEWLKRGTNFKASQKSKPFFFFFLLCCLCSMPVAGPCW